MGHEGKMVGFFRAIRECSETLLVIERNLFVSLVIQFGSVRIRLGTNIFGKSSMSPHRCYFKSCISLLGQVINLV